MSKFHKFLIINMFGVFCVGLLSSCGGGSSGTSNDDNNQIQTITGSASSLTFTTPYLIPSVDGKSMTGYIQVSNPTSLSVNHIDYGVKGIDGKSVGNIKFTHEGHNCRNVEIIADCILAVTLESSSSFTGFSVVARNQNANQSLDNRLLSLSSISSTYASLSLSNFNIVGIQPTDFSNVLGADGINLYYHNKVLKDTPYIIITGVVSSDSVGDFNNVTLVDDQGHALEKQVILSNNLGAGAANLTQGDVFALRLGVPPGLNSKIFKLRIDEESTTGTTEIQTSMASYNLTTVSQEAIISVIPQVVTLSNVVPSRLVSLANFGDVTATNIQVTSMSDNLQIIPLTVNSLESRSSAAFTVSIKDPTQIVNGSNVLTISYNNGKGNVSFGITVNITGANPSGPTPGLNLMLSPDNNFYTTSLLGSVSRTLTLTNQGNTNESNFEFVLPTNFTLTMGNTSPVCNVSGSTVSNTLLPNESCSLNITYTNHTPTAESVGVITVNYNYGADSANAQLSVNYMVTQTIRNWIWEGGESSVNQPGNYLSIGTPGGTPGARGGAVSWTDKQGNLWLFGGTGYDSVSSFGALNDLWQYNVTSRSWIWESGSNTVNQVGNYPPFGTVGGYPGARGLALSAIDESGNLWLFGGAYGAFDLNDLWQYNRVSKTWTWEGGESSGNQPGNYPSFGTVGGYPGARDSGALWVDHSGNLWLFGGNDNTSATMNDLWQYNIASKTWTWEGGESSANQLGSYPPFGTSGGYPGSRNSAMSVIDESGNLWLFGGIGYADIDTLGTLNDLWQYNTTTKTWIWESGSNTIDQTGSYPEFGSSGGYPGARGSGIFWADNMGNLWIFGGRDTTRGFWYNDMWKYNIATKTWTWVAGENTPNQNGIYQTPNVVGGSPGARFMTSGWVDNNGYLWLFGGLGYANTIGFLNDLWRY